MEGEDCYTNDGTVDINNKPANKKKTGKWKACRFILGTFITFYDLPGPLSKLLFHFMLV